MSVKMISDGKFAGKSSVSRLTWSPVDVDIVEEEIRKIFKEGGDFPNCLPSRRIQDNISDLQAQAAANAVGGG